MDEHPQFTSEPNDQKSNSAVALSSDEKKSQVFEAHRWVLRKLLKTLGDPPVEIELWNGEVISTSTEPAVARVRLLDRHVLRKMLANLDPGFGDMYSSGRIEVEGNLVRLLEVMFRANQPAAWLDWVSRPLKWLKLPRLNKFAKARQNIYHHYDISNKFYRLWLDEQLVYTCAYFPTPETSLEDAQIAKMDHVARKLRLQPGEKVIEAGCGWGALSLHFAKHYGVTCRAFNISREQIAYARERAKNEGLADRVEFVEDDYRNISGECDKFVSVGMLEHVGLQNYRELGNIINRCLRPDGLGLIHSISRNFTSPMSPWMEKRIFPGAYIPALSEITNVFEPHDLSVLDVENIRLHYAKTLEHWLARFEKVTDQVRDMFDEEFIRVWRLYLAASEASFTCGIMQLFQVVFSKGLNNNIPWTREDIYLSDEK